MDGRDSGNGSNGSGIDWKVLDRARAVNPAVDYILKEGLNFCLAPVSLSSIDTSDFTEDQVIRAYHSLERAGLVRSKRVYEFALPCSRESKRILARRVGLPGAYGNDVQGLGFLSSPPRRVEGGPSIPESYQEDVESRDMGPTRSPSVTPTPSIETPVSHPEYTGCLSATSFSRTPTPGSADKSIHTKT